MAQAHVLNGLMRFTRIATCVSAGVLFASMSVPALAQGTARLAADATQIASIVSRVRAEIARLPVTSTAEEYEAAILFVVDQASTPPASACAAFNQIYPDPQVPANAKTAMRNVCRTLSQRRGTGAIPAGSSFSAPGFSAPVIGPGGGSNYSSAQ